MASENINIIDVASIQLLQCKNDGPLIIWIIHSSILNVHDSYIYYWIRPLFSYEMEKSIHVLQYGNILQYTQYTQIHYEIQEKTYSISGTAHLPQYVSMPQF